MSTSAANPVITPAKPPTPSSSPSPAVHSGAAGSPEVIVLTGNLFKRNTSALRRVRSSSWARRVVTLYTDGTLSYKEVSLNPVGAGASATGASITAMSTSTVMSSVIPGSLVHQSSSSSSEDEDGNVRIPLFPYGVDVLSRQEQIRMAEALPPGADMGCMFKLRLRGPRRRTLYLCAETVEGAEEWRRAATVSSLASLRQSPEMPASIMDHHYFLDAWDAVASSPAAELSETDLERLAKKMSLETTAADLRRRHSYGVNASAVTSDRITYDKFTKVEHAWVIRNKLIRAWLAGLIGLTSDKLPETYNAAQIGKVLNLSEADASALLTRENVKTCDALQLMYFVCARDNAVLNPEIGRLGAHEMTQPLSSYYISSSHNTYLLGDQVKSKSSAEMYRVVLDGSARCVEVDLWDGDGEPVVTHGHTLTSVITFKSVLRVIKQHAFVASPYPVIISIESHLSEQMQVMAAENIVNELGESLCVFSASEVLLSPEELKGKIIIKAKKGKWNVTQSHKQAPEVEEDSESTPDEEENSGSSGLPEALDISAAKEKSGGGIDATAETANTAQSKTFVHRARRGLLKLKHAVTGHDDGAKKKSTSRKKTPQTIAKELANVTSLSGSNRHVLEAVWLSGGVHPSGQLATDVVSLGEAKIIDAYASGYVGRLEEYNKRNLTRVYPKASRVDSGNYNPLSSWRAGCHLVALNWQSADFGLWLNHGRFLVNGNCGYALKNPPVLDGGVSGGGELTIEVVSGFFLPHAVSKLGKFEIGSYYVEVSVAGCGSDGVAVTRNGMTAVIKDGFAPTWREKFNFRVNDAALEMVVVSVWDRDRTSRDERLGFYCAPVYALRTGIRAFHLFAHDGTPLKVPGSDHLLPTILCDVSWCPDKQLSF